jgi:DNA-directed RNA polymerase specialized sigma24 family protein
MNACREKSREWKYRMVSFDTEDSPATLDLDLLSPENYVKTKEQIELLNRLLGKEDADLFLRYCVYGEKASTIAAEMNMSEQAVRMRISRLKKKVLKNRNIFTCLVCLCLIGLR